MADQNYKKLSELDEMKKTDIDGADLFLVSDSSAAAKNAMSSKKLKYDTLSSTVADGVVSYLETFVLSCGGSSDK